MKNILLVDDKPENLLVLESVLDNPELHLVKASSGNEALSLVLEQDFDLVLLDVKMPEMDGIETAELMQGIEKTKHIPIIFLTAMSKDEWLSFKGSKCGAMDYISKPMDAEILIRKVEAILNSTQVA